MILATKSVKYNTRKKITFDSQFTTNSNRISLVFLENLILEKDDFIKKNDVKPN